MLLTFRRERRVTLLAPLLSLFLSLAILPVHLLISGARTSPLVAVPVVVLGLGLGGLRGLSLRMTQRGTHIVGRYSRFFLGMWGLSLALSQLLNTTGSPLLAAGGLLPMFFTTGGQVGLSATIFMRRIAFRMAPG